MGYGNVFQVTGGIVEDNNKTGKLSGWKVVVLIRFSDAVVEKRGLRRGRESRLTELRVSGEWRAENGGFGELGELEM